MPIFRPSQKNVLTAYIGQPYSVGGIGSSGSNAVTVPAPPTQQASQGSLIMGHQSPAQALQTKIRSILTQDEVAMFIAMTERVKAAMTDDEVGVLHGAVGDMLGGNLVGTTQGLAMPGRIEYVQDDYSEYGAAVPPEGIQPGYNCLDPDMATTIVVNWLDHGDDTVQDLNDINGRMPNGEYLTDGPNGLIHGKKPRPKIAIERLYVGDGGAMASVNAMLAGCTLQEPDCYRITDGLVEVVVTHDMIAEHRKPLILAQQSLAVPSIGASQSYTPFNGNISNTYRKVHNIEAYMHRDRIAPPADEIAGPPYDEILNERDKRLHDERLVQEGAITLSESGRSASKLTPKGTKMTVRFPMPRANPLTGVPDPSPRALLLQEGIRALRQVDDDTADDLVQNHNHVGVQLELTEFDPALVPPGVDAAALVIEQGLAPLMPVPTPTAHLTAPPVDPTMTAIYTPTVDLATLDFDGVINEAYRTLDFTWSHCHPRDSYFSCLIMKAIEGAEEQVRMSPLNAPDMATAVGLVLAEVHAALAVSVHLPGPVKAPMSPGQLAAAMPGSTITAGGISGTFIGTTNATYNPNVLWQPVNAWSNQGGMQGIGQYLNVQAPTFNQLTDEDGDEIPSIRIRNLRPGFVYRGQDGSEIEVDATGNFTIKDEAAQITYRATRMRDFNRFVNGSDLVGEFIEALGALGANQEQAAGANLEMFIRWLVHEAAEHDKEEPPVDVPIVALADVPAVSAGEMAPPILIDEQGVRVADLVS